MDVDDTLGTAEPLAPQPNLTATLARRLREEITSGRLVPGAQLPSESQLVRSFQVSRTVVREAVAALRAEGLVATRQGRGAFVLAARSRPPFAIRGDELSSLEDIVKVLELRAALEVAAAALAAERRQTHHLQQIAAAQAELDRSIQAETDSVAADFDFHVAIARATDNAYFPRLLESIGTVLIPRARVKGDLGDPEARHRYLAKVSQEHAAIVRAIASGDAARARRAMHRHLAGSRYRLLLRMARDGWQSELAVPHGRRSV